jgi:hypothetical protein
MKMTTHNNIRPNALGDLRAEADIAMLDRAFLETADYQTLIETSDRLIIVGRRGTGKSALTLALVKYLRSARSTHVVILAPEEHQIIGLRPLVQLFGDKFLHIRAGTRLVWRYALMLEVARCLAKYSGVAETKAFDCVRPHLDKWNKRGHGIIERFRHLLRETIDVSHAPESRIGDLPVALDLTSLQDAIAEMCQVSKTTTFFLIDRLDEGYEPDDIGVGLIDGLLQAAIDIKTRIPTIRPIVFLRDNIFRAVQAQDQDFSRTIEGHVLRLHWDERSLLEFAGKRLSIALHIEEDSNQKVWNACVLGELKGPNGFAKCLQKTLYRPRDLLALLNDSLYEASKQGHAQISLEAIESTAKIISQNRLDDLRKEYGAILQGLPHYLSVFQGRDPELRVDELSASLEEILNAGSRDPRIQQDFFILEDAKSIIRGMYSIGFLGIKDPATGTFVFCHDGRAPDREFAAGTEVLIHPCYWMALNSTKNHLDPEQAQDIYDEYDIEVSSETPTIRNLKITALIQQLGAIADGAEGDSQFEVWCHKAIRICFAKGLRNVELQANKLVRQRRDVVATNLGESGVWQRIHQDFGTRQVIFEIRNYKGLTATDYQQINSYLGGDYGRLAFAVCRDDTVDLFANHDVQWVRDLYMSHQVLIVKLTGKYLTRLLYKLRNPQKHDDVDNALHTILDTYTKLYLAGQTKTEAIAGKRERRRELKLAKRQRNANVARGAVTK